MMDGEGTVLFDVLALASFGSLSDGLGEECHELADGGTLEEAETGQVLGGGKLHGRGCPIPEDGNRKELHSCEGRMRTQQ